MFSYTFITYQVISGSMPTFTGKRNPMSQQTQQLIEQAWDDRSLLQKPEVVRAIEETISGLDRGELRVAEPKEGKWEVNQWIKKAVILYFPLQEMETIETGPFEFHDKIPLKKDYAGQQVRVVPHALARYGSFLAPGVILMPSYVNIGSRVGAHSMIDTWATVGSCAQIGEHVHISGGVGIGGVLEPVQAAPVIIEDHCFIGSRCVVVEGVHIGKEAVLGANVVITGSTRVIDASGNKPVYHKGYVPPGSVVVPATYPKEYPAGTYHLPCALIIGKRKESTDRKTSLNDALRDYNLAV